MAHKAKPPGTVEKPHRCWLSELSRKSK